MRDINKYIKLVEWSEEDQCYIGRVPGLTLGGIHGSNEIRVFEELGALVEEWIAIHQEDDAPLPPPTAGKKYSGKFNLRVGKELHEYLTIESLKAGESLNQYCVKALKEKIGKIWEAKKSRGKPRQSRQMTRVAAPGKPCWIHLHAGSAVRGLKGPGGGGRPALPGCLNAFLALTTLSLETDLPWSLSVAIPATPLHQ